MAERGTILIVTAETRSRSTLSRLFERAGYVSREVATGEEALNSITEAKPSLVVLDLDLEDLSGYGILHELRERLGDHLPIILLSGERTKSSDRVAGLLIGADDYVAKPFDPEEILARARRLMSRIQTAHPTLDSHLTGRELQVLGLLAQGLNQRRIAKELFISSKTVGTHIQRILTKLHVHSRTEAVALAYQAGLVPKGEGR